MVRTLSSHLHTYGSDVDLADFLDLVGQVANVRVVEGHMVTVASKDNQVVLVNDSSVAVPGSGPLALHVENLGVALVAAEHWGSSFHSKAPLCLPLAHLLVVLVKVGRLVILYQK